MKTFFTTYQESLQLKMKHKYLKMFFRFTIKVQRTELNMKAIK